MRRAFVTCVGLSLVLNLQGQASAAGGAYVPPDGQSVQVDVSRTTGGGNPAAPEEAPVVPCVTAPEEFSIINGVQNIRFENGKIFRLYRENCGTNVRWFFVQTNEFADLIRTIRDRAIRQIPPPAPTLIPTSTWQYASWPTSILLPAESTTVAPITATIPGFSITVTPTLTSVVFDPGNDDDKVVCPVIPRQKDDCTYTYPHSSKDQPDLAFPATLQTTWALPYTVSTGATGTVTPAIILTTQMAIQVARIQVINV